MATIAQNVAQSLKKAVNSFATDNFTTSGASGLYDRARPSYPVEAVEKFLSVLGTKTNAHIVEVGAGTGIFTQCLVRSPTAAQRVAKITAVEPSTGMRQSFNSSSALKQTAGKRPEAIIVDGSFAEIPADSRSIDIVVGAQCFHWSHPDYASSVAEFARVLKPGGTLAFIWNLEDRERSRWIASVRDVYEAYEQDTPQYRRGWWKEVFETAEYKENFEPAQRFDFQVIHPTTEQGVIDRVLSKSYITSQTAQEQTKIAEKIREILKDGKDRIWIDQEKGEFEYPYQTNLYIMQRKA